MEQKKNYEAPAMEVVGLKLQGSLLAGSSYDATIDDGTLNNFDNGWE